MRKVISKQAKDIVSYLTKNGFSKDNPFVPEEKIFIQEICECPGKYQYPYDVRLLNIWPEDDNLHAMIDQVIDGNEEGMPKEEILLDYEPEDIDWENDFPTF